MQLAQDKVVQPPSEYAAFCQHLLDHCGDMRSLAVHRSPRSGLATLDPDTFESGTVPAGEDESSDL